MVTDSNKILSKQFKSVLTTKDTSTKGTSPYPPIPGINVTLDGVKNLLLKSDLNESAGPDNIHAAFLKHPAFETAPLLIYLFQQSLRNGIVPASSKQVNITLIYKKVIKHIQVITVWCLSHYLFVRLYS